MLTDRITAQHLQRNAIVYVRQSSPEQVRNHAESTRIQVGLRDKAVAFGWGTPVTIVDDLGVSAAGFAHRAGFQHMVAEVSLGHVGIIATGLARMPKASCAAWPAPGPITRSPPASTGCACVRAPAIPGPRVSCRSANGWASWTMTKPGRRRCSR
jgi:hypothetical protein